MLLIGRILTVLLNIFGAPFGFIIFFLIPTIILSIPAWIICRRHHDLFWWEIGLPVYGMLFWLLCMMVFRIVDVKGESLVNLYFEPFIVAILSLIIIYIKTCFLVRIFENQRLLSAASIVILFVLIFLLRLFMPALPE